MEALTSVCTWKTVSCKHLWYLPLDTLIHRAVRGAQLQLSVFSQAHSTFICMHAAGLFGSLGLFRTTIFMVSANRSCRSLSGTGWSLKKEKNNRVNTQKEETEEWGTRVEETERLQISGRKEWESERLERREKHRRRNTGGETQEEKHRRRKC